MLCLAVTDALEVLIRESSVSRRQFHLALTGGEVGGLIARELARRIDESPAKFSGLHVWWSDERFVPHDDYDRNARVFVEALNDETSVHIHESTASDSNIDVETSARRYSADMFAIEMDVTLLSVGTDGHVASLFPGLWHNEEVDAVVAIHNAPKSPPQRVSFSMSKINSSARVWLLASGIAKVPIVKRLVALEAAIPATHAFGREETILFTDLRSD